jgi:hypothetical protein
VARLGLSLKERALAAEWSSGATIVLRAGDADFASRAVAYQGFDELEAGPARQRLEQLRVHRPETRGSEHIKLDQIVRDLVHGDAEKRICASGDMRRVGTKARSVLRKRRSLRFRACGVSHNQGQRTQSPDRLITLRRLLQLGPI